MLNVALRVPTIYQLVKCFKEECQLKGWETSEHEDWVKLECEYHNFLWIQSIHASTFEKVTKSRKCAINKGSLYLVVDVSYTAWLFPETPSESLMQLIEDNPNLSRMTAIYDLSSFYEGNPICKKLNKTDSRVFREFEMFLKNNLGVKFQPFTPISGMPSKKS